MANDRLAPLDPHPRVINDRIVTGTEGTQDGGRDKECHTARASPPPEAFQSQAYLVRKSSSQFPG
jgi:hypothetical protein